jgi:hypothetical protein
MKHLIRITIFAFTIFNSLTYIVHGQTLSPKVISTSGGYATGGGNSLSFTIGETFNTTFQSGNVLLTQGQQQTYISLKLFNLKAYIQGFYAGAGTMTPVLSNTGISTNPLECDSIIVELHDMLSPSNIEQSITTIIQTDGTASIQFPESVNNNSYYIVVRHRNSIETWSKFPVSFNGNPVEYDFTTP